MRGGGCRTAKRGTHRPPPCTHVLCSSLLEGPAIRTSAVPRGSIVSRATPATHQRGLRAQRRTPIPAAPLERGGVYRIHQTGGTGCRATAAMNPRALDAVDHLCDRYDADLCSGCPHCGFDGVLGRIDVRTLCGMSNGDRHSEVAPPVRTTPFVHRKRRILRVGQAATTLVGCPPVRADGPPWAAPTSGSSPAPTISLASHLTRELSTRGTGSPE